MELSKDPIAEAVYGCDVAMGLADNAERLNGASSHDLVAAAATLTRAIIRVVRFRATPDDMPRMMAARQTITAEIRRRMSAVPRAG
jgi:hypothetical protein